MIEVFLGVTASAVSLILILRMLGGHGFDIGTISASFPFGTGMSTGKVHITIAKFSVTRVRTSSSRTTTATGRTRVARI